MSNDNTISDEFISGLTKGVSTEEKIPPSERNKSAWASMLTELTEGMDISEYNAYMVNELFGERGIEALRKKDPTHHFVKIYDGDIPMDTMPDEPEDY